LSAVAVRGASSITNPVDPDGGDDAWIVTCAPGSATPKADRQVQKPVVRGATLGVTPPVLVSVYVWETFPLTTNETGVKLNPAAVIATVNVASSRLNDVTPLALVAPA
jgi:hypothetical protein